MDKRGENKKFLKIGSLAVLILGGVYLLLAVFVYFQKDFTMFCMLVVTSVIYLVSGILIKVLIKQKEKISKEKNLKKRESDNELK